MGEGHQKTWVYLSLESQVTGDRFSKLHFLVQIGTHTPLLRLPVRSHKEAWGHMTRSTQMLLPPRNLSCSLYREGGEAERAMCLGLFSVLLTLLGKVQEAGVGGAQPGVEVLPPAPSPL